MVGPEVVKLPRHVGQVCNDAAVPVVLEADILHELVVVEVHFEVNEPALKGGADVVGDGSVGVEIASGNDHDTGVELAEAHHAVEDQFVGGCLHGLGGRVEFVQEDDPAVLAFRQSSTFDREHVEGHELGDTTLEVGQAGQVFRGTGRETNVQKLHAVFFSNGPDDGRLAHTRRRTQEGHKTSLKDFDDVATGLTRGATESRHAAHFGSS